MATPSLLIIPDRYKAGKLYSQLPESGAGDLDFSRASTATRVNASGLIESVASGVPRLDYSGGGCPSLLLEPQKTNIATYNETDAGTWGATTPVASGTIMGVNAYSVSFNFSLGDAPHNVMAVDFIADTTYTASVLVDFSSLTANFELALFCLSDQGAQARSIVVDRITKIATSTGFGAFSSVVSSIVTQVTGEIYKVTLSVNFAAGLTGISGSRCDCFSIVDLTSVRIAALQVEDGNYSTSYILKTTTSSVTRLADVASKTGVSGFIGQTAGTIYAEIDATNFTADDRIFAISDGTSDNTIILQKGANATLQAIVTTASGSVADIATASGTTAGVYKIALAYAADDFVLYVNGTQIGTDTSGAVPACSQVFLGKIETSATTNQLNDRIRAAAVYTTRLSNSQLAALTTL